MSTSKDLSSLVDSLQAKAAAKPSKAAIYQAKLDAKIASLIAKGKTVVIDGATVTAYDLDTGSSGGGSSGGSSTTGTTYTLGTAIDLVPGTANDDTIIGIVGTGATVGLADQINGGAGNDTLQIYSDNAVTLPAGLASIENIYINDTVHQDYNIATLATTVGVRSLELDSGTASADNAASTITLAAAQTLTLDSVTDADAANDGATDGEILLAAAASVTSMTVNVDGVGNQTVATHSATNDLDLDVTGTGVTTATINGTGVNNISLANTGAAMTSLVLSGTGSIAIQGALANAIVTVNAAANSGGVTVTTGTGNDNVTGGSGNDNITTGSGSDNVSAGEGDDTVNVAGNLTVADTLAGGNGNDTLATTTALTDALVARLSSFEIVDVGGSNGITHDVSDLTSLQRLDVLTALGGATVITDLAETASVRISAAVTGGLTVNQANSTVGSPNDTISINFNSATALTTGAALITPSIETINLSSTSTGTSITHTVTAFTAANATSVNIAATTAAMTIADLTALQASVIDASGSTRAVSVTTGADTFTQAFLFTGGTGADVVNLTGGTTVAGTIFSLGSGLDTITTEQGVREIFRTSATTTANSFVILDDGTTANTAGFDTGTDDVDYNGTLSNDGVTTVVASAGATLQAAYTNDNDATVFVVNLAAGVAALEAAGATFAGAVTAANAAAVVTAAAAALTGWAGLDAAFTASESVLILIDSETNDDAGVANNGGSFLVRFTNTSASGNTVIADELQLIGYFEDAALAAADFI